jgi:hypothetical protein
MGFRIDKLKLHSGHQNYPVLYASDNERFVGQNQHGWFRIGAANSSHLHMETDRENFYFYNSIQNAVNIKAPIYYDINDTNYYIDGASTSNLNELIATKGRFRRSQTNGNYTTAALWTESYNNTTTGIAFHISGNYGGFLEMRTDRVLYWKGHKVWTAETDGSGSGLDADTVDGNHASAFALASHGHNYLPLTGGVLSGNLDVNADIQGNTFTQAASGIPRNNLGSPTVSEMALFDNQFVPKTTLANNYDDLSDLTFWKQDTSSSAWVEITTYSDDDKRRFLRTKNSNVVIPSGAYKFRVEFVGNNYHYANAMYAYWSSNSHNTQVHVWKYNQSNASWHQHTSSSATVSSWPGHLYLPFDTIPWHETITTSTGHHKTVRIEFTPTWSTGDHAWRSINLYGMEIWGGYPSGRREPHYYDHLGKFHVVKDLSVAGSSYTPITYDSNNTSYYSDPSATSNFNVINATGGTSTEWNTAYDWGDHAGIYATAAHSHTWDNISGGSVNGWGGLKHTTPSGYIEFGPANSSYAHIYTDTPNFYFNKPLIVNGNSTINVADIRSHAFYDIGDTNYYVNPAGLISAAFNGSVGIGTTSPSYKLDIYDSSSGAHQIALRSTGSGSAGIWFDASNGDIAGSDYAWIRQNNDLTFEIGVDSLGGDMLFTEGGSERMRISSGNVGIGTTSPQAKLEVQGSAPYIFISDDTETESGIIFRDLQAGYGQAAAIKFSSADNKLRFYNNDTTAVRMTINTNGNVGIGETDPTNKLHVGGSIKWEGVGTAGILSGSEIDVSIAAQGSVPLILSANNSESLLLDPNDLVYKLGDYTDDNNGAYLEIDDDGSLATFHNSDLDILGGVYAENNVFTDGDLQTTGRVQIDGVKEYRESFTANGNSTLTFDVDIKSIGASGQPFEVFAGWTHYSTSYGCMFKAAYFQRSTIQSNITLVQTLINQSSLNAGFWSVSYVDANTIRITKNAGSHTSSGHGYIRVTHL